MAYRVKVTEIAAAEIDDSYSWLKERSPAAAERWYDGLIASLKTLHQHPQRCARVFDEGSAGAEIRQLIHGRRHGRYRILFTISGNQVQVVRVLHGARALGHLDT
jgi:plasmid stabilization system protein ParE